MTDFLTLWRKIEKAGGREAYIQQQLQAQGFLVDRRNAEKMKPAELKRYKKALRTEAEERKKLAKEAWQAYRESHIVHLGENVYWNDAQSWDKWDLPEAEARASENELPTLENGKDLAEALELSMPELRSLTYHREAATYLPYIRFTIPKRKGGTRDIWAPSPQLKQAQRWVLQEVVEKLPVHGAAHGFLPGRSIVTNAAPHADAKLVVKQDIKDFFPSVTVRRVKGVFRKAGYREQVATLLAQLCTESPRKDAELDGKQYWVALGPRCLPQGAPTSPALTNTLCLNLDRRLHAMATKLGWRYTRYADDMTFSLPAKHKGKSQLGALLGGIKNIVPDEGFTLHPDKTRVLRKANRQRITGLVINDEHGPRVDRVTKRKVRAAVHNLSVGKPLAEGETIDQLKGYISFIHMSDPTLAAKLWSKLPTEAE